MAYNFPDTPVLNQVVVGPQGVSYLFDGSKWLAQAQATTFPQPYDSTQNAGRNLVHNAVFAVAQRGAGPWTTNGAYTADRWFLSFSGDTVSATIVALGDAARTQIGDETAQFTLAITFTGAATAGNFTQFIQRIENVRRLAGKTVAISFWATASAAFSVGVRLSQFFGSGGSPSAGVDTSPQAITLSTSWVRYSLTIAVPSVQGKTFGTTAGTDYTGLTFGLSSGSTNSALIGVGVQSGSIDIYGIQLEIAQPGQTQPTPLDRGGTPQQVLAECQRFYTTGTVSMEVYQNAANISLMYTHAFPVTMRATPTIAYSSTTYTNASAIGSYNVVPGSFAPFAKSVAAGDTYFTSTYTASADL